MDFGITGGPSLREQLEGINLLVSLPGKRLASRRRELNRRRRKPKKEKAEEEKKKKTAQKERKSGGETFSQCPGFTAHPDRTVMAQLAGVFPRSGLSCIGPKQTYLINLAKKIISEKIMSLADKILGDHSPRGKVEGKS